MKHNNARKLTALLLALVLILPIISIPAVADSTAVTPGGTGTGLAKPNTLYSLTFDDLAPGKISGVSGPSTAKIVVGPDGRGNVMQIDCTAVGNENNFYVHFNKDKKTWAELSNVYLTETMLEDGTVVPYLTGTMKPLKDGLSYNVEGVVNTDTCAVEVTKVTDEDGNPVEYKDIIVKGYTQISKTDEQGNFIWVPVLDENGQQVIGKILDENGNVKKFPAYVRQTNEDGTPKLDENSELIYVQDTNEDGSLKFDADGNPVYVQQHDYLYVQDTNADGSLKFDMNGEPVYVQQSKIVLDEEGNPIMDTVLDPVTGRPVYKRDENGQILRDENNKVIVETQPRVELIYEPHIGEVETTIKIKINNPSSYLANSVYIVTEALRDAYGGGINNIATPALVQHPAIQSSTGILVFSADYFFSAAIEDDPETPEVDESVEALTRGMDVRFTAVYQYEENGVVKEKNKNLDLMNIANPSEGKITLRAHEGDAPMQVIGGNKTIDLGTWVNILIAVDMRSGTYLIYVDGELMCIRQDAVLSTDGPSTSHWEGPCVSVKAKTWNIGHFTRGGKVSDYKGFAQIDNISIYDGSKLNDLFAYYGYSKEFEEDYENEEVGTILDTYFNGSSPEVTVGELDGNKVAAIDLTYAGNVDANFKPKTNAVTYVDSKTVVLESDYYLTEDAVVNFQSQLHEIGAHIDVPGSPFADPKNSNKTYKWIDLFTVDASDVTAPAKVTFAGATIPEGQEEAPVVTVERGRWNTFSTVINLANGSYIFYVNGVYAMEGRLTKLINGEIYNFTDVSFAKQQWIVAKIMKGNLNRQGMLYLDEMMITEMGGGKADTVLVEAMLSADIYANGVYYTTVTDSNVFYKSSDITIDAEVFDLKEQVGTEQLLTMVGASIRFTSPTGLRFASEVDLDALNALYAMVGNEEGINLKSVCFGTLIIPTDLLGDVELSFENLNAKGITNYLDIPGVKDYYYDLDGDESTTHICGSILDIKEKNITRLFTGVNYVRIVLPNGIEYNIYSDRTYRASAQSVADDAWGEYEPAEQAVIDAFLAGVKPAADTPVVPPPADPDEGGTDEGGADEGGVDEGGTDSGTDGGTDSGTDGGIV